MRKIAFSILVLRRAAIAARLEAWLPEARRAAS
jgi:hypothetical protein